MNLDTHNINAGHPWLNKTNLDVYNAWDVYNTAQLRIAARAELVTSGNALYHDEWMRNFVPVVMRMQRRGFGHVDLGRLADYSIKLSRELREVEREALACTSIFGELRSAVDAWESAFDAETATHTQAMRDDALAWAGERPSRKPDTRLRKADEWHAKRGPARERKLASLNADIKERRRKFFNMSKDLKHVAFNEFALRPAPKTKDRASQSLDQSALLYILDHMRKMDAPATPFLHALCHRSRLRTIQQRYLKFWYDTDGRVYPTINCASARTMRLSYSEPALQQWVSEIRHIIRTRPGYVFVGRDYSQIEARVFALECNDQVDIALFAAFDSALTPEDRKRYDVHTIAARARSGLTDEQWNALPPSVQKLHRDDSKRFRYRIQYGGDDQTEKAPTYCPCIRCVDKVPQLLGSDSASRIAAQQRWFTAHPAVMRWQQDFPDSVRRAGNKYKSRFGYTREFYEPWPRVRTKVLNCPCQHGAAEIVRRAMERLDAVGLPLVLQMHDELIVEVPLGAEAEALEQMRVAMEAPVPEYQGAVFPTEGKSHDDWGGLK